MLCKYLGSLLANASELHSKPDKHLHAVPIYFVELIARTSAVTKRFICMAGTWNIAVVSVTINMVAISCYKKKQMHEH